MKKYIKLILKAVVKKFMPCSHNSFLFKKRIFFSPDEPSFHAFPVKMVIEDKTFPKRSPDQSPDLNCLQTLLATSFPGSLPSRCGGTSMRGPWEQGHQKKRNFSLLLLISIFNF